MSWLSGIEKRLQGDDEIENRLIPFDELSSQIVKLTAEYMVNCNQMILYPNNVARRLKMQYFISRGHSHLPRRVV